MSGAPTTALKRATETALQGRPTSHEAWGDTGLEQFLEEVHRLNREGDLVLIALPSIDESPTAAVLAQKASVSLLCILLGVTSSSAAKRTIDRIGRASFVGSAVFHPPGAKPGGDRAAAGR